MKASDWDLNECCSLQEAESKTRPGRLKMEQHLALYARDELRIDSFTQVVHFPFRMPQITM